MRRLLLATVVGVLVVLPSPSGGGVAWAGPFEEGREAEERYDFPTALDRYRAAANGAERAAWLTARAEGDFQPLAQLERARRDPAADLDQLVMAADEWPPGLVRCEAWVFAADAYHRRGHPGDAADAVGLWRKAARDPKADPVLANAAIRSAVRAHLATGDLDEAQIDLSWRHDDGAARDIERLVRRGRLHLLALAFLALVFVAVGATAARARRVGIDGRAARQVLGFAAFIGLGGATLALGYDGATAAPFLWFSIVLVPLLLAARAWAALGGAPRPIRAAACAASVAAAAFLVLEHTGHLDALGL